MEFNISNKLQNYLYMTEEELFKFSKTCPHRYKVYPILKKNGGQRIIAHPAKELKYIQRFIVNTLKSKISIHHCSFAYKNNINIKHNALLHSSNTYILKMDFKDFFPSITPLIFFNALKNQNIYLSKLDSALLANLLFWKPHRKQKIILSIGAPSSPLISNIVMYEFDNQIFSLCKELNITYSRYADDLTFSTQEKNLLHILPKEIKRILNSTYNKKIRINSEKTSFISKSFQRKVTGLIITNDNKVSIGRDKKRLISSMLHKYKLGILKQKEDIEKLTGLLSFAFYIEPDFQNKMIKKYGLETMKNLLKNKNPPI
ncbi:retron St85 family RNA-directed DNA polymerase [Acinetobacter guillouiae]|uniref:retron St85 family RNA-directed DNA polymerase n=1 Tax=Acinetobacter guillouiae TaxID=106649 RepID=UPI003AF7832E